MRAGSQASAGCTRPQDLRQRPDRDQIFKPGCGPGWGSCPQPRPDQEWSCRNRVKPWIEGKRRCELTRASLHFTPAVGKILKHRAGKK